MHLTCFGRSFIFASSLLLIVGMSGIQAQTTGAKPVEAVRDETYDKVLDLLFPRPALELEDAQYIFVIRYEPTWKGESQIIIIQRAGVVEIIESASEDGNIYLKLGDILRRGGQENPARMAKQIRVRKRAVSLSPIVFRQLRDNFFDNWIKSLRSEKTLFEDTSKEVIATFDGTAYQLWYQGIGLVEYKLGGSSVGNPTRPDEDPLIEWMKTVKLEIDRATEATPR